MIQLLNTYLAEGKIYEALLVGQNLAYKTCNKTNFKVYWDLLIKLAKKKQMIWLWPPSTLIKPIH